MWNLSCPCNTCVVSVISVTTVHAARRQWLETLWKRQLERFQKYEMLRFLLCPPVFWATWGQRQLSCLPRDFWLSGWGRGDSSKIWRHWRTQKPIYVPRMWTHMNCQSLLMIIIGDQWLAMPTNDYQWVSMTWKKLSKNSNELLMNINDINAFQCISMMLMHINVINGFHCKLKRHINECEWTLMNFNQYHWISMHISQKSWIPVVPHKAVAEVSKIGNL